MPCAPRPPEPLSEREIAAAEQAVAFIFGRRRPVDGNDKDDVVQIVLERWTRRRGRFNESGTATIETYVWKVANNVVRDLLRRERTEKRGGGRAPLSLEQPVSEGSDTTVGDLLPDRTLTETVGGAGDHALLRQAIAQFRTRLGPRDRAIFDAFGEEPNPRRVAALLGLPPSTVYGWLGRIRRQAEDAGLRKFLV